MSSLWKKILSASIIWGEASTPVLFMKFFINSFMSLSQARKQAQGPKPFIHKSFRLLYVKDEKNKELGDKLVHCLLAASLVVLESPHQSFSSQEQ